MRLAAIFSDHMVLQREKEVRVFGEAEDGSRIRVEIDGTVSEDVAVGGRFLVRLPAHGAGGPYTMTVTEVPLAGKTQGSMSDGTGESAMQGTEASRQGVATETGAVREKIIQDVFYGEVWIDNGQSNIEFELQNADGGEQELSTADLPEVRYFKCIKTPVIDDAVLEQEAGQTWRSFQNGNFRDVSGVGYFFAKKLHAALQVPVGIIDCYQGGTSISCWLSEDRLARYPEGRIYQEEYAAAIEGQSEEDYDRLLLEYNAMVERHLTLAAEAKAMNPDITPEELSEVAGDYPWPPPKGLRSAFRPSGVYHTMLERIAPVAARGILYYQGEEDSPKASGYTVLLTELIREFREIFEEKTLPVVILQLPMFIGRGCEDVRDWAYLREAQEKAVLSTDHTLLVPLIDCGEYDNVHPTDKTTPGEHTAREVLEGIYEDRKVGARSMHVSEIQWKRGELVLHFTNTYGTVTTGENILMDLRKERGGRDAHHVFGFEVRPAGQEAWIVPKVVIDGEEVRILAEQPVEGIRYGFFNYGKVNLYNAAGLPLCPFQRMKY